MSLTRRYLSGQREEVWRELRRLGPVPVALREDVDSVAAETMRRVHGHVERIVLAFHELGFEQALARVPVHAAPTADDQRELHRLELEIGGLPAALRACLAWVGEVSLMGDCPPLGLAYNQHDGRSAGEVYPDPMCLPGVDWLREEWANHNQPPTCREGQFQFLFAPDQYHKANVSGDAQTIVLPSLMADPIIVGVDRHPDVTLVEYLRLSVAWGGCPGWAAAPNGIPKALHRLRVTPDF